MKSPKTCAYWEHNEALLDQLPELINKVYVVLELLILRITLLALAALGAYSLLGRHPH
jgi:hypothetical protein